MPAICPECGHFDCHFTTSGRHWHGCRPECHESSGEDPDV